MKRAFVVACLWLLLLGSTVYDVLLRVGTTEDSPPFAYRVCSYYLGFEMELIAAIAVEEGFQVAFINLGKDLLIPALTDCELDIVIANIAVTQELREIVDFSDPYWSADQHVISSRSSNKLLDELLESGRIGVEVGTVGDLWISERRGASDEAERDIIRYATHNIAMAALKEGLVDAVLIDESIADAFPGDSALEFSGIVQTGVRFAIAVQKGNEALIGSINNALKSLSDAGKTLELATAYFW